MGTKNNPNLHTVKFALSIADAFRESLRWNLGYEDAPDIRDEIHDFVTKVEEKVDAIAREKVK